MTTLSKPYFVFPCSPFNPRNIDETFLDQVQALKAAGFGVSSYSHNISKIHPIIPEGSTVVYRGWMMQLGEYERFYIVMYAQGLNPLISPDVYKSCHHLPNWYSKISDLTSETYMYSESDDLVTELSKLGWNKFFIKDYVKSLKTAPGSIISKPEEITAVIDAMKKYRGFIEGGICVRRYEEYKPNSETRVFVLNGRAYEPSILVPDAFYDLVKECIKRIDSPFFTIDIALRTDNTYRVIEIGDGQVSDLVDPWKPEQLVGMFIKDATRRS